MKLPLGSLPLRGLRSLAALLRPSARSAALVATLAACSVGNDDVDDPAELALRSACYDADPCGEHGTCIDDVGIVECQCEEGWVGRTCAFERTEVLEEFVDLPDPTGWSSDPASGRSFRRATAREQEANDWKPGTFVVTVDGLDAELARGSQDVFVTLPTTDTTTMTLELGLRATDTSRQFVELDGSQIDPASGDPRVTTIRPTFDIYGSKVTGDAAQHDLHGAVAVAISAHEVGEYQVHGVAQRLGLGGASIDTLAVGNPNPEWILDPLPGADPGPSEVYTVSWTPSAQATWPPNQPKDVCALPIHITDNITDWHPCDLFEPDPPADCGDGIDNDGDGTIDGNDDMCTHSPQCDPATAGKDYPPHTHTTEAGHYFALLGEVGWCTRHKTKWYTSMYKLGLTMEDMFFDHMGEPGAEPASYNDLIDLDQKPMRFLAGKCWLLDGPEKVASCRCDSDACAPVSCAPFEPGSKHEYPYRGLGDAQLNYQYYLAKAETDLAHAVKLPPPYESIEQPVDMLQIVYRDRSKETFGGKTNDDCHRASILNDTTEADSNKFEPSRNGAHEFGHSYSCDHCDARILDAATLPKWSLMYTDAAESCYNAEIAEHGPTNALADRFAFHCASAIAQRINDRTPDTYCYAGGPTFGY